MHFLDLEVAKVIAEVEASVFVLDFVPNASVAKMKRTDGNILSYHSW